MDAAPILARIAELLARHGLEAVLIGNAAAALQGAPVSTIALDFLFRKTPSNVKKLKAVAAELGATLMRPAYPVSDLFRIETPDHLLLLDFVTVMHGIRSFEGLRKRARTVTFGGAPLYVAGLADIIRSKKAAGRPQDVAVLDVLEKTLEEAARHQKGEVEALKKESDLVLRERIRHLLALPPEKRTHFLRKRVGIRMSCL
jgi:hypothetical protein